MTYKKYAGQVMVCVLDSDKTTLSVDIFHHVLLLFFSETVLTHNYVLVLPIRGHTCGHTCGQWTYMWTYMCSYKDDNDNSAWLPRVCISIDM